MQDMATDVVIARFDHCLAIIGAGIISNAEPNCIACANQASGGMLSGNVSP